MGTVARRAALAFVALALCAIGLARADEAVPRGPPFDPRVTSIARLLAGLEPGYALHARIAGLPAWQAHARALAPQWQKLRAGRFEAIEAWRDAALAADGARCRTLLYPFSGPDFLNAYLLFPQCDAYVFVGLEAPGSVPALDRMADAALARTLADTRAALQDLLAHNFYMTKRMAEQLTTPHIDGVAPLIVASMGAIGVRITEVAPIALPTAGAGRTPVVRGVRVTFSHPELAKPQTLTYLSADASNAGFGRAPELGAILAAAKPAAVLVKAGSYLLHRPYFSRLRDALLAAADLIVQDDTGIPYQTLRERGWAVALYGTYTAPIPLFKDDLQPGLASAYRSRPAAHALPFAFGYKGSHGESNAMVARNTRQ